MTKKSKRTKKLMRKRRNRLPSKKIVFLSTLATALLFLVVVTFAWFTSTDSVVNAFSGTHLVAEIDEVFQPNKEWKPGENTQKEVKIKNTGDVDAFIRVSLYEFLLSFQIDVTDQTGNANLKTVDTAVTPTVDDTKVETWDPAAKAGGTYESSGKLYVAKQAWVSDPARRTGMYQYSASARTTAPYKYITLNFPNIIREAVTTEKTDYWLYEDGYFYYSRPLKPGESTEDLLKSVSLSSVIPNQYKGSLYKLKVYMDAHDVTDTAMTSWSLSNSDQAYQLLSKHLD